VKRVPIPFGTPNELQRRVIEEFRAGKRLVLMVSGRQGGKSHFGARWLLTQTMRNDAKHKLAMAVAPTFRLARVLQRKLEEVLKADPALWKRIKHTKQPIPCYEFPNGWMIEVHSAHDPDALRGPSVDAVWFDEVAKAPGEAFDILIPTLLATGGSFLGTTTPRGKQNWTYRKLYLKSCEPGHPDFDPDLYNPVYSTVIGSTWENVENLSADAIRQLEDQYGKDSAFGRQEISGEFVSYEGLVYKWDEGNFLPHKNLPPVSEYSVIVGGLDFGWTDPAAAVVMGYKDGNWFALDGIYEAHLDLNELAEQLAALTAQYSVTNWYADSSRPDTISDLRSRNLPVQPVVKPKIEDRLREMAIFADHNRLKVSYRAPFVRDELQVYQYPEDDRLFRDKDRRPLDHNNHAMDAIGYAIWSVRYLWRNDPRYLITRPREEDDPADEPVILREQRKAQEVRVKGPSGLYGA
jgi:phage terminase large subunit-like protein